MLSGLIYLPKMEKVQLQNSRSFLKVRFISVTQPTMLTTDQPIFDRFSVEIKCQKLENLMDLTQLFAFLLKKLGYFLCFPLVDNLFLYFSGGLSYSKKL